MGDDIDVLQSSAGVITLDENAPSLTVKSSNFSENHIYYFMDGWWHITGPPGSKIVISYNFIHPGQETNLYVYEILNSTDVLMARFSDISPPPGYTVFSGNEVKLRLFTYWDTGGDGVIFKLNITGRSIIELGIKIQDYLLSQINFTHKAMPRYLQHYH